jgi:hypothetical protein
MTKKYKLGRVSELSDPQLKPGIYNMDTGYWIYENPESTMWQEYLKWLAEGNTPLPPDPTPEPEPLTPQQKLEAAGLTIEELKELLGL